MHGKRRRLTRAERRSMAQQAATTKARAARERAARREAADQNAESLRTVLHSAGRATLDRLVDRAYRDGGAFHWRGPHSQAIGEFLRAVLSKRPRLADPPYLGVLEALAHVPWSQEPTDWRPARSGSLAALRSLVQHLLGPYPIPAFLVESLVDDWLIVHDGVNQLKFAALVGRGDSVYREARGRFIPQTPAAIR